jgi:malonyl-CoA/methylmalonyl-CoA synthetase
VKPANPADWIDDAAQRYPQRVFLRTETGRELNYAALRDESARFASALTRLGVGPGERVAAHVDKSAQAVLLYVACLRMGAVFVPINPANTAAEVDYFLRDSEPRVAVLRPADLASLEAPARRARVAHIETLGAQDDGSLADRARQSGIEFRRPQGESADAPAAIVYTSGTTGRSKGAMLTRANLASNAAALAETWRFTGGDVLLHTLPLFHVHGLFAAINTVLASASGLLLLPKFDAALALEHLPRATVYMGVPTHYTRLLQLPELNREAVAGVRLFISGSAPLLAETHREFSQRTGHAILERYGMTETLMITSNPCDGTRVPGSVGTPLPGIEVRLANGETGSVQAGTDVIGALEVKGPNVFAGYWRDAEKTRGEFTSDGWFKTGDLGRIDPAGYVHILGRAKDLVISGGYNVYPKEVEAELDAVPGVLESAVFGVPHPDFGEGVSAAVVLKPGAEVTDVELIFAVRARLAAYKIPKRVVFVEELPRTALGKVKKSALRAAYRLLYQSR